MMNAMIVAETTLRRDEGFRSRPYKDTHGNLTVMYGRNLDANPFTKREGEIILKNSVTDLFYQLSPKFWFRIQNAVRQGVLLNMAYNLGVEGLLKFKRMIAALLDKDYELAADELMDSDAARELTTRYSRLERMMRSGKLED